MTCLILRLDALLILRLAFFLYSLYFFFNDILSSLKTNRMLCKKKKLSSKHKIKGIKNV
jgi:hypothetical protein